MSSGHGNISPTDILGMALFFLASAPSLWLTGIIINFGNAGVAFYIILIIFAAIITLPAALYFLTWFFIRMNSEPEPIHWMMLLVYVSVYLLIGNAVFLAFYL